MISDVIALFYIDRLFIWLNTVYFIGLHQLTVRCFFKALRNVIPDQLNKRLFYAGLTSSISMPMVGVFDNKVTEPFHNAIAIVCFSSAGYYLSSLANLLYKH